MSGVFRPTFHSGLELVQVTDDSVFIVVGSILNSFCVSEYQIISFTGPMLSFNEPCIFLSV